jgi:hypothetical protein
MRPQEGGGKKPGRVKNRHGRKPGRIARNGLLVHGGVKVGFGATTAFRGVLVAGVAAQTDELIALARGENEKEADNKRASDEVLHAVLPSI